MTSSVYAEHRGLNTIIMVIPCNKSDSDSAVTHVYLYPCYFWILGHSYTKMTSLMSIFQETYFRSWRHRWRCKRHVGFQTSKRHYFAVSFKSIWIIDTPKSRSWNKLSRNTHENPHTITLRAPFIPSSASYVITEWRRLMTPQKWAKLVVDCLALPAVGLAIVVVSTVQEIRNN